MASKIFNWKIHLQTIPMSKEKFILENWIWVSNLFLIRVNQVILTTQPSSGDFFLSSLSIQTPLEVGDVKVLWISPVILNYGKMYIIFRIPETWWTCFTLICFSEMLLKIATSINKIFIFVLNSTDLPNFIVRNNSFITLSTSWQAWNKNYQFKSKPILCLKFWAENSRFRNLCNSWIYFTCYHDFRDLEYF